MTPTPLNWQVLECCRMHSFFFSCCKFQLISLWIFGLNWALMEPVVTIYYQMVSNQPSSGLKLTFNLFISRVTSLYVSLSSCQSLRYQRKSPKSSSPSKTTMLLSVTTESNRQWKYAVCCWTVARYQAFISTH